MRKGVYGPLARSGNSPPPELVYNPPPDDGLDIVQVDDDILVLSKPAGLLSVAGNRPELQDCLEARVQTIYPGARIVHRLDRPTSGVFLMALNAEARRRLGIQFEKRKASKTYIAIVEGQVVGDEGTIRQNLRTDWYCRPKQMVDNCLGREAVTRWRVLERHANATRMELTPVTGRSHQLRVHMQWLGHSVMGDEFYCASKAKTQDGRLMLHAERLEIYHPRSDKRVAFEDPCRF